MIAQSMLLQREGWKMLLNSLCYSLSLSFPLSKPGVYFHSSLIASIPWHYFINLTLSWCYWQCWVPFIKLSEVGFQPTPPVESATWTQRLRPLGHATTCSSNAVKTLWWLWIRATFQTHPTFSSSVKWIVNHDFNILVVVGSGGIRGHISVKTITILSGICHESG